MEVVGTAVIVAALVYFVYEGVTGIYALRNPSPPYKDADPVLGRDATVCRRFSGPESSAIRTGAVELNGSTWEAETSDLKQVLDVGDRCKVSGRDGLRLVVEPASRSQ